MQFSPGLIHAEDPAEEDGFDGAEEDQTERAAPEIKLVHHAGAESEYGELAQEESDDAEDSDGLLPGQGEFILEEGDGGLRERNGGSDAGKEEKGEPEESEEVAEAGLL